MSDENRNLLEFLVLGTGMSWYRGLGGGHHTCTHVFGVKIYSTPAVMVYGEVNE